MNLRVGTRASKIQDGEDVDVLRSPERQSVHEMFSISLMVIVFLKEFIVTRSTAALQNGVSRKKIIILFVLFLIS